MELIGRQVELERVGDLLAGGAAGVVLAGPAGVGRSRLADAGLQLAGGRGLRTVRVAGGRALRSIPLGALAPLLTAPDGSPVSPTGLLARPEALLAGDARPCALLVDDAHLLDDLSAALVGRIASERLATVILTVRSGVAAPDPIVQLWRDGILARIDVAPLDDASMDALADALLDGPVEPATRRRLVAMSAGNPQNLTEVITVARDGTALTYHDGLWRMAGDLPVPSRLVEHFDARYGTVDDDERDALETVALGQPLGLATLEQLASPKAVAALERRGLLAVEQTENRQTVRIADPLYREVVLHRIPASRVRAVSGLLLDDLEETGCRRRDDVVRRATYAAAANHHLPAEQFFAAAEVARHQGDLTLAERLIRSAVSAGAGFDAALLDAELAWLDGDTERAEASLAALSAGAGDETTQGRIACLRVENLVSMGRLPEALEVAQRAETLIGSAGMNAEVAAARAAVLLEEGDVAAAYAVVVPLLERPEGRSAGVSRIASACLARMGRPVEALAVGIQGQASVAPTATPTHAAPENHWATRSLALIQSGRIQSAQDLLAREHARAGAHGNAAAEAALGLALANVLLVAGQPEKAVPLCREAVVLYTDKRWPHRQRLAMIRLAHALALAGQAAEARRVLDGVNSVLPHSPNKGADAALLRARAWLAVTDGELGMARRQLTEAARLARDGGDGTGEFDCLHDLTRLGQAPAVVDRLEELRAASAATLIDVAARYAAALCGRDADGLEQASAAFERMGSPLFGAEAAAEAATLRYRSGEPRRAAQLEARVAELARRCDVVVTPAVVNTSSQAMLTARQLEIATLAAAGVPNRGIAERLYLSVRTVETQLQRSYEKLGIDSRSKLAQALHVAVS